MIVKLRYNFSSAKSMTLAVIALVLCTHTYSQELNKEVYVVSSFRPTVEDANKISILPVAEDTVTYKFQAEYNVLPSLLRSDFQPRPIKPAKMAGTPLDKLYKSYLKLGIGNYITPVAEYSIHNLRSKEYSVGAYIFHRSSYNKMELDNDDKVPAGYGRNDVLLYGKRFYDGVNVSADVGMNTHRLRYYGYNVNNFTDSLPDLETRDIKQSFYKAFAKIGVHSADADSGALEYALDLKGEYFQDYYSVKEPNVNLNVGISHPLAGFRIGLNAGLYYASFSSNDLDVKETITELNPYVLKKKEEWEIRLAGRFIFENTEESKTYFYPDAWIRLKIINDALFTRLGVNGYLENNSYQSMSDINPYISPGTFMLNTNHEYVFFAELEGYLSRKASWHARVSFDAMINAPFYVNDNATLLENTFSVVYDDADLINYYFDFYYTPLTFLSFSLSSNIYSYKLAGISRPYHKPSFDLVFNTQYNFKEKIYAGIDFIAYGKRYAQNFSGTGDDISLDPIYDLNLKLEYKYSNILSGFLHFYNLTTQRNYYWNQYPEQRLNVILGITYKF